MVIHFQDATIALGTVMASIRLGFVAPLADTHTTIPLFFN